MDFNRPGGFPRWNLETRRQRCAFHASVRADDFLNRYRDRIRYRRITRLVLTILLGMPNLTSCYPWPIRPNT
jgi:hypothetical protein